MVLLSVSTLPRLLATSISIATGGILLAAGRLLSHRTKNATSDFADRFRTSVKEKEKDGRSSLLLLISITLNVPVVAVVRLSPRAASFGHAGIGPRSTQRLGPVGHRASPLGPRGPFFPDTSSLAAVSFNFGSYGWRAGRFTFEFIKKILKYDVRHDAF